MKAENIECFNTIYFKRDKGSNTMAKIIESYHQAQLKEDTKSLLPTDEEIEKQEQQ